MEDNNLQRIRDWARLPSDLLHLIASNLPEIPDRIRFISVCAQWRSINKTPKISTNLHHLPWLLLAFNPSFPRNLNKDGKVRFLSLSENRTYTISLPEICNRQIYTSAHGWLVAVSHKFDEDENIEFLVSLVNPATHSTISLPPLFSSMEEEQLFLSPLHPDSNVKLLESGSDLVVVVCDSGWPCIFVCSAGDDNAWRKMYPPLRICWYGDYALHNGNLFAFDRDTSETHVFDMSTCKYLSKIPTVWNTRHKYYHNLIESLNGELLLVLRELSWGKFLLFRLDESEKQRKWVRVSSIGGYSLFENRRHAMCFGPREFKGYNRNCIYFLDDTKLKPSGEKKDPKVFFFDIEENWVEQAQLSIDGRQTNLFSTELFIPSL